MPSEINEPIEPSLRMRLLNLDAGTYSVEQVPLSQIAPRTIPVSRLTTSQVKRLTRIYKKFAYLIYQTLETWLRGFTYDLHPETEILVWESLTVVFSRYNNTYRLTLAQKREIARRLLRLVVGEQLSDSVSLELVDFLKQEQASKFLIRPNKPLAPWENIDYKMFAQIYTEYVERHQVGIHDNKDGLFVALTRLIEGNEPSSELGQELLQIWQRLEQNESGLSDEQYFNPDDIKDERIKSKREVVTRPGQRKFKSELMKAYGGCCSITGCSVEAVLQAAHIIPYLGTQTDHPSNGLLLRVDIHKLFDSYYLSINPETNKVEISPVLKNTYYEKLAGQPLRLPKSKTERPNQKALTKHYRMLVF